MDGFKIVTVVGTLFAIIAAVFSIVLGILNRRSTAKKETVDGMLHESARRDRELTRLESEVRELREELAQMKIQVAVHQSERTRLERVNAELLAENRTQSKTIAKLKGRDSDDAYDA